MNLVGKIFVVLVFALSLVFMSFGVLVGVAHKNWMNEVLRTPQETSGDQQVGWKYRLEEAEKAYQELKRKHQQKEEELAVERSTKRQQVAKLESELQRLLASEQEALAKYIALAQAHQEALSGIQIAQSTVDKLQADIERLREQTKSAQLGVDEKASLIVMLTEQVQALQSQIVLLKERHGQLVKELAQAEGVLRSRGLSKNTPIDNIPPMIEGKVLAVDNEKGYVEISLGSDDGLEVGHPLEVFRGGKYMGQVVVATLPPQFPNKAVARIIKERQQGFIQPGDDVRTRRALADGQLTGG